MIMMRQKAMREDFLRAHAPESRGYAHLKKRTKLRDRKKQASEQERNREWTKWESQPCLICRLKFFRIQPRKRAEQQIEKERE